MLTQAGYQADQAYQTANAEIILKPVACHLDHRWTL